MDSIKWAIFIPLFFVYLYIFSYFLSIALGTKINTLN